jgi:signal transduction histidine kinase/ActR/RegA family two-component response regulator
VTSHVDERDVRVSCRCVEPLLDVLQVHELQLCDMLDGVSADEASLRDMSKRVSWADFAVLCDNIVASVGGLQPMWDAGRRLVDAPSLSVLSRLASLAASPADMYWVAVRWALPSISPCVNATFTRLNSTTSRIEAWVPEDYRANPTFFAITAGNFEVVVRLLGQPDSVVQLESDGCRAVFTIMHQPSFTIWGRIGSGFRLLFNPRSAFEELGRQNQELARHLAITQAAKEKAELAIAAQATILTAVSHELRTPLTAVLGMLELIAQDPSSLDVQTHVAVARDQGKLLVEAIDDVMRVAALGSDDIHGEVCEIDVAAIVRDVVDRFRPEVNARGIELRVVVLADSVPLAVTSFDRVRSVVHHLVSNACKFTSEGWIEVRLDVSLRDHNRMLLTLEVEDTGVGIEPQWIDKVFLPFVQREEGLLRSTAGIGLGLAIVRGVAGKLDGEVLAHSVLGQGSTFTVTMDLARSAELAVLPSEPSLRVVHDVVVPPPHPAVLATSVEGSHLALIVDDNAVNRLIMSKMAQRLGYQTQVVENGKLAVDALRNTLFELVLMDIQMPVMDGLTATRELRRTSNGANVPVVAVTAQAAPGDRARCLSAGMDAYVPKPIDLYALRTAIGRATLACEERRADIAV